MSAFNYEFKVFCRLSKALKITYLNFEVVMIPLSSKLKLFNLANSKIKF